MAGGDASAGAGTGPGDDGNHDGSGPQPQPPGSGPGTPSSGSNGADDDASPDDTDAFPDDASLDDAASADDTADSSDSAASKGSTASVRLPGRGRRKKPTTLSLQIRFESLDDTLALARLVESTVWVNDAHPAYKRAVASRAEAYHVALAVAAALAPLAVEPADAQQFVSAFLAKWGEG
jgi:hypothetical protein